MAITSYLDDFDVDPETKQVLDLALEMTRTALGLADDLANGIIAKRIIELARAGERHPDVLCEGALKTNRLQRAMAYAEAGIGMRGASWAAALRLGIHESAAANPR